MSSHLQSHRAPDNVRMKSMAERKRGRDDQTTGASSNAPNAGSDELIARNLKLVYDEIAAEPLPDHLAKLLQQLDAKEGEKS
jgi:hypothetical protein